MNSLSSALPTIRHTVSKENTTPKQTFFRNFNIGSVICNHIKYIDLNDLHIVFPPHGIYLDVVGGLVCPSGPTR